MLGRGRFALLNTGGFHRQRHSFSQSVRQGGILGLPSDRETVGPCPRCCGAVTESKKGFFCENRECRFVLWKDSKFFSAKKKSLTKSTAASLLKNGRVRLKGCWSEKTGKTYDATVVLEDDGERSFSRMISAHSSRSAGRTAARKYLQISTWVMSWGQGQESPPGRDKDLPPEGKNGL